MMEREEKYRRYADTLSGHLASCDRLLEKASAFWPLGKPIALTSSIAHPIAADQLKSYLAPQESLVQSTPQQNSHFVNHS